MSSPLEMQPSVLMNRFIINLRSINTAGSSQGSSARQHWSRFSAPNFRIPDSFLGNIGEELQDGHHDSEPDAVRLNTEGSPEAEPEVTSTAPGSSVSCLVGAQVSLQDHPGSTRDERTLFYLD